MPASPLDMKMLAAPSACKVAPISVSDAAKTSQQLPKWKRTLDIICCVAALPMFVFCTLIVAIVTRLASPGPVFFRQERVGRRGRRFQIYKFRTMHVRADASPHQMYFAQLVRSNAPMHKLDGRGDGRLIPGGRFIRATGLDELPQIINVLRGEMSIVGPRPCIPYEYAQYSSAQRQRFEATPGLTGLWQVSGKNSTTFDEMVRLDIQYAQTRSPRLDLRIIVRTIPALCVQVVESRRKARAIATTDARVVDESA
jgi:lipopolysaccharide/colanic/teichoic acid biosynthesis glycosyltransferase